MFIFNYVHIGGLHGNSRSCATAVKSNHDPPKWVLGAKLWHSTRTVCSLNWAISLVPIQNLLLQPVEPAKFHMGIFQRALSVSRQCSSTDESTREGELKSVICTKIPSYYMKSREHASHCHNAIQAWDLTTQIALVLQASNLSISNLIYKITSLCCRTVPTSPRVKTQSLIQSQNLIGHQLLGTHVSMHLVPP